VGVLGGIIGLGGAEFRSPLPLLRIPALAALLLLAAAKLRRH
jgi:hypothetical protein